MRVALVTSRYPPNTGGVETHVAELASGLTDQGHEVLVVSADADTTTGGDDRVAIRETRDSVTVRRVRSYGPDDAFHAAPGVYRAVRRLESDVIHAHNYHSFPMALAALAADPPLVCTPHYHGESTSPVRDRLLWLYRPLGRHALRRAARVLAVSEWERDGLRADLGVDATVVPNGIDVERFQSATPVEREHPYLLTVGRLVEYKSVQHVIAALPDLPEYDFCVVGSGPYRDELETTADRHGVANRVEFLGYVPDEDLPSWYAGADVFVSMSSIEAYGITVGEALAAGTPAVVRPAKALRDWADREDCVAVDPVDLPDGIGRAVDRDAPSEPLPTWGETVETVESVYESVASRDG